MLNSSRNPKMDACFHRHDKKPVMSFLPHFVIPAKAGIHNVKLQQESKNGCLFSQA
jgi:hypothetical protein